MSGADRIRELGATSRVAVGVTACRVVGTQRDAGKAHPPDLRRQRRVQGPSRADRDRRRHRALPRSAPARSSTHQRCSYDELIEDRHDWIATHLLEFARTFSVAEHHFYAFYLLSHGVVKAVLVVGLLREKLWAYPASFAVFGAFIAYQLYRYSFTHDIGADPAQHLRPLRDLRSRSTNTGCCANTCRPTKRRDADAAPDPRRRHPREPQGQHRRARQFRRLPSRPPGGGRPRDRSAASTSGGR